MRSSNPVFSRRGFSRDSGYAGFNAQQPQAGGPAAGQPVRPGQRRNPYATNPYAQQDTQLRRTPQAPGRGPTR